jgi:hypothetical protein
LDATFYNIGFLPEKIIVLQHWLFAGKNHCFTTLAFCRKKMRNEKNAQQKNGGKNVKRESFDEKKI